jgi:filamentous hemagglutinin family protein
MNRTYRLVWSRAQNAWVPVAETARRRGKSGRARSAVMAATALSLALMPRAQAGPLGGQVTAGRGSIAQSGTTTDIYQSSPSLSINWLSFNIAPQETVDFIQPSSSAIAVNRVGGSNGSQILGHLESNGQVYIINPNGVLFGPGSQVNVGGLVASTLDVSDASLGSNTRSFSGSGAGSVVNEGMISAAPGGGVALLGNHVGNQGLIAARLGTVALAAGSGVSLTFNGNSLVHLQVDRSVLNSVAANGGLIQANGGQVLMTAGAQDALLASVVNNTGVIEARTVQNREGTITLLGGMTAGTVNVGGTLDASAAEGGNGGHIETSAAHVEVTDAAKVTTTAPRGLTGSWLIDPQDFTVAASGGDITGAALSSELGTTSVTLLSSSGAAAGSGNVNVNDPISWKTNTHLTLTASNNVNVNASITVNGALAGITINPNSANGKDQASGTGVLNLGAGAAINLPSAGASLSIGGTSYTVITSLGAAGSVTGHDLQGISGNLSGHYALGSNIDATPTSSWNSGAGFAPLGNSTSEFTGTFDGLGHTIANLFMNLPTTNDVGLFGAGSAAAVIRNVGLLGGSVTGFGWVGGLMGLNSGGTVNNTYTTGSVSGSGYVGGLVGVSAGGTITNSHATGNVNGSSAAGGLGGLVGSNYAGGVISNSYATGNVNGSKFAGGLVGANYGSINNTHATGSVNGSSYVGGLVGGGKQNSTVSNSYAIGAVTGGNYIGGLMGFDEGSVIHSYATGTVSGANYVGGAVGAASSTLTNVYATGSVTGSGSYVGGLVGELLGGSISNSYATGRVSGGSGYGFGGLVGFSLNGTISNSYATGALSGYGYVGGLVGQNGQTSTGSPGQITNSYATGSVSGSYGVGGLVGFNAQGSIGTSYATGHVMATVAGTTGGLVGITNDPPLTLVNNSFWNVTTTGQATSAGGVGLTTAQMLTAANFAGFTFTTAPGATGNNWVIVDANGTLNNAGGAGGGTFPMLASEYSTSIINAHQLQLMAMNAGASYTLAQNIDATATGNGTDVWSTAGFAPIGNPTTRFTGTFDGLGHSITNLTINQPTANYVGLFGYGGPTAVIRNVGLIGGSVSGANYVGGLVGFNYGGSISNSSTTGSVTGAGGGVGGLVGINFYAGAISNSYSTGNVTGSVGGANYSTGGLVGASFGLVSNSYATGLVLGSSYVGGLVGFNGGTINTSYATGGNRGTIGIGGLVGGNNGTISNSYSTGAVSGNSNLGGLVGGFNDGMVNSSFWDMSSSHLSTSAGGIGMTTANMQTQANFTSATAANGNVNPNWDLANTWVLYDGHTDPLLRAFMTPITVTANSGTVSYNGSAYAGANGVTYSVAPNGNLLGTLSFSSTPQPAINVGNYVITPGGLYSNQQGYIIGYGSGSLTINQLASVAWVGGATGNWSMASNWAGGAIPDLSNVAAVTIPKGTTVTYDAGVVGTTILSSLTDAGKLVMAAGDLSTTGNLTVAGYTQGGGTLDVGGTLSINAKTGAVKLGDIDADALSITTLKGTITQLAGSAVDVTGTTSLTAENGTFGLDTITLAQAGDSFGGTVTAEGSAITLRDKTALTAVLDSTGATSLTAAGALNVSGTVGTTLTTKTSGPKHTTTFGATTVGTSLVVTSTGAVTETSSNILTVDGEGTTTIANPNVTVNGVKSAEIPAP